MFYDKVKESADYIMDRVTLRPHVGIILGSGLGELVNIMEDKEIVPYEDIPHFPHSSVAGHAGNLVFGRIGGNHVLAMQGRYHYYEGGGMEQVTYPCYVMKLLGITDLVITNACGGINRDFRPGDLMLIDDCLDMLCPNPLIGENDERFGTRFPGMGEPYSRELSDIAERTAGILGIDCKHGVYGFWTGPSYESAADIRAFSVLGADAVGMSTVPETIVANYLGMRVLGISCITNMGTGIQKEEHSHEDVVRVANKAGETLCIWVKALLTDWK